MIARKIAEYTALGAATTPRAPITATVPSTQNTTASPVDMSGGIGGRCRELERHDGS